MSSRIYRSLGLFLIFSMGGLAAGAQEPLTLRQAINEALGQTPEAAIARAEIKKPCPIRISCTLAISVSVSVSVIFYSSSAVERFVSE